MSMQSLETFSSWREVSASALRHNVTTLKQLCGPAKLGVVVKADAYGHGLAPVTRTLVEAGTDWLVVNFVREATAVRAVSGAGDVPIYVCGTMYAPEAPALVDANARCVLYDVDVAGAIDAAARAKDAVVPVHIKIETGTNRQGLDVKRALELAKIVAELPGLKLEGLTTHFADIEDTTDHAFADSQLAGLEGARRAFIEAGYLVPMIHSANSAATILDARTHADLVRVGIAAYGLWPSKETLAAFRERRAGTTPPTLEAVLSWRCRIAQVKDVQAGAYIGYGRTFRTTRPSKIAILPVGYYEGYDRRLSNVAHAIVNGTRAPVRGRVCMNMTMIDVTDVPSCKAGDVATLLGSDGDESVSAEQLAAWMGTIHYEAVSRIHGGQPAILT
jgi:alanine racemase